MNQVHKRGKYGWRAGSGLFLPSFYQEILILTGIGGPRHRYYFACHYIILSTSCVIFLGQTMFSSSPQSFLTAHLTCNCASGTQRPYAGTSAGASSPSPSFSMASSSPPTFRLANRPSVQPVPIASHSESGETSIKTYQLERNYRFCFHHCHLASVAQLRGYSITDSKNVSINVLFD